MVEIYTKLSFSTQTHFFMVTWYKQIPIGVQCACVLLTVTAIDKKIAHSMTGDSSNHKSCKGPLNY